MPPLANEHICLVDSKINPGLRHANSLFSRSILYDYNDDGQQNELADDVFLFTRTYARAA